MPKGAKGEGGRIVCIREKPRFPPTYSPRAVRGCVGRLGIQLEFKLRQLALKLRQLALKLRRLAPHYLIDC